MIRQGKNEFRLNGDYKAVIGANRKDAIDKGLAHYWGSPCKHGHDGLRYVTNGQCRACFKKSQNKHKYGESDSKMVAADHLKPEPNIMDDYYDID